MNSITTIFEKYNSSVDFTLADFISVEYLGGHNKWIVKYPKTHSILRELKAAYDIKEIDYNWITDYFGGRVSEFVSGVSQKQANKFKKQESISWDTFVHRHSQNKDAWIQMALDTLNPEDREDEAKEVVFHNEWKLYAKPRLIDYVTAKSLKTKKMALTFRLLALPDTPTIEQFLRNNACFRRISKSQYNIFKSPNGNYSDGGIFARNGMIKAIEPEQVGDFIFQLSVDTMNYTKDLDNIDKLWTWRTGRNEKRSALEERFGYDVKHMSHLLRLLIGARNILTTGEYNPRLTGDNLALVKSVLNGEKTYDWVVKTATKWNEELEELYIHTELPKSPNHKRANELLLEISRSL